ncbi:rhomboid family intramembrane serine protease [Bdellovibrio bacteriovorus]|uniref:rhomboid family intramembrane serine protease n=1 Tax=Bdellovibrio bacteriovorus TaxID=959 RepID=UPI001E6398CA|nr:rhomboid family intramembrane serine protease [Bdellovibrio bacteriovorus]
MFALIAMSVVYWRNWGGIGALLPASGEAVFKNHEYWRLWTALFAHADLGHLASNSLGIFVLGYFLSGYFSLWFFPVAALLVGGLTNYLTLLSYDPAVKLVGISGVVYWMGAAWLILYLLLDQQRTKTQRMLRAFGVALGVFFPASAFDPSISYLAHWYGFLLGLASGAVYYFVNRKAFLKALIIEQVVEDSPSEDNLKEPRNVPPEIQKKKKERGSFWEPLLLQQHLSLEDNYQLKLDSS